MSKNSAKRHSANRADTDALSKASPRAQPELTKAGRIKSANHRVSSDPTFQWVHHLCIARGETRSKLEGWREHAEAYMTWIDATSGAAYAQSLSAISLFLRRYVWKYKFCDPKAYLQKRPGHKLPALLGKTKNLRAEKDGPTFKDNAGGKALCNYLHNFLSWVVVRLREADDIMAYEVPFDELKIKVTRSSQSKKPVLGYDYIVGLRRMLAPGPNFSDWRWAQKITGAQSGALSGDWFEITKDDYERQQVEKNPDCVVRVRSVDVFNYQLGTNRDTNTCLNYIVGQRKLYEMWSPARSLALLCKLSMCWRTFQVRVLDSGETDHWRVELDPEGEAQFLEAAQKSGDFAGELPDVALHDGISCTKPLFRWVPNPQRTRLIANLGLGDRHRVLAGQGVCKKLHDQRVGDFVGFFINTNKTADIDKPWSDRGYTIHYQYDALHRWFVKMRNWQEKYNPIRKPTLWSELGPTHLKHAKGAMALRDAAPTCFLFRDASARGKQEDNDERKPITASTLAVLWTKLLSDYQTQKWETGYEIVPGVRPKFVRISTDERGDRKTVALFGLHSLRISLITALADAGMKFEDLVIIAGHARLIMTIYYRKLNPLQMNEAMKKAQEMAAKRGDQQLVELLLASAYEDIEKYAVVDRSTIRSVVPSDPHERNATGWARVHCGWCLAGGNTEPLAGDRKTGCGCFNGGPATDNISTGEHEPVRTKQCVAGGCRFLATHPGFDAEIAATMDVLLAELCRYQHKLAEAEYSLRLLNGEETRAYDARKLDKNAPPFTKEDEKTRAVRLVDHLAAERNWLISAIANAARLMDRVAALYLAEQQKKQFTPDEGKRRPAPEAPVGSIDPLSSTMQLVTQGTLKDVKEAARTWNIEPEEDLLKALSIQCWNAEVYPELEIPSHEAIRNRSQILDAHLETVGGAITLSRLPVDKQLILGNDWMWRLAKLRGGETGTWEDAIGAIDQGTHGRLLKQALAMAINEGSYKSTPIRALLA